MAPLDKTRRDDLDVARAIAILSVVLFHICQYFEVNNIESFSRSFSKALMGALLLTSFPTFMLVAGLVLGLSGRRVSGPGEYIRFQKTKFCRLMLPFISVSLIHLLVKLAAPGQDRADLGAQAWRTLLAPAGGLAGHLWFLYCLMSIFLLWPLLDGAMRSRWRFVLLGGIIVLAVLPLPWPTDPLGGRPSLLGLKELARFLPIFAIGFLIGSTRARDWRPGLLPMLGVVGAGIGVVLLSLGDPWSSFPGSQLLWNTAMLVGLLSGAFVAVWISGWIVRAFRTVGQVGAGLGRRSYDIYLLHVALVGHPLAFLAAKLHPDPVMTYVLFGSVATATLLIPLGLGELIRRVPIAAFFILGVPRPKSARPAGPTPAPAQGAAP